MTLSLTEKSSGLQHEVSHRFVKVNGIRMHVAEQGRGTLVLLCHGFPESWYSWRHQLSALAAAGYHAVAPDQRGYGQTEKPEAIEAYTLCHLVADMAGLVRELGEEKATIVGHDWGAIVAWSCALLRPDIFPSLCLMSVPYLVFDSSGPKPTEQMKLIAGDKQFYQLYFQQPGKAEKELEADVRASFLGVFHAASGEANSEKQWRFLFEPSERFIDTIPCPTALPTFLRPEDLDYFTDEFTRSGFRGGLNWYRNMDRNAELLAFLDGAKIEQPTLFVAGERDPVITIYRDAFENMETTVPNLRGKSLIRGTGHWVQQERPEEVNRLLLKFLASASNNSSLNTK
jgi:pimeloyl-ACP methyl ester carboxylesterase